MKRPLLFIALAFSLGIFFAGLIKFSFILAYFLAVIFFLFCLVTYKRKFIFSIFLLGFIFCLGIIHLKNSQILPKCHIFNLAYKNAVYIIKGYVDSQPQIKSGLNIFFLRTVECQKDNLNLRCCGRIKVILKSRSPLVYGQGLVLKGRFKRPFGLRHRHFSEKFIFCVKESFAVVYLKENKGFFLLKFIFSLKEKLKKIIYQYLSYPSDNLLAAMILGERRAVPKIINDLMIKTGTVHILVVSGFHVGVVSFMLILFFKFLGFKRRLNFSITILCLLLYCLITGASSPTRRATVMAVFFLLGYLIKREPDIYNSLSLAAIFILGVNPEQLFDVGFKLSFASVISIIYLYPALSKLLVKYFSRKGGVYPKVKYLRFLIDSCLVSFSAWIGTAAIVAYYFKIFSPVAVLANLLVVPLAGIVVLAGFSFFAANLFSPYFASLFANSIEFIIALILAINYSLIKLPGAYFIFK